MSIVELFAPVKPPVDDDHRTVISNGYQVQSDGRTVWVNAPGDFCVGRFSAAGYEIERIDAAGKTLERATHGGPVNQADWRYFVRQIQLIHSVSVGVEHLPRFLRRSET